MVALVQDVTEQKRSERALCDSEERFRRMVEIAAKGIWIVDTTGKISFVNDRMPAIPGYNKEEMLGRLCADLLEPEERDRVRPEVLRGCARIPIPDRRNTAFVTRKHCLVRHHRSPHDQ
jgi:PAS domain S-box-containing protein